MVSLPISDSSGRWSMAPRVLAPVQALRGLDLVIVVLVVLAFAAVTVFRRLAGQGGGRAGRRPTSTLPTASTSTRSPTGWCCVLAKPAAAPRDRSFDPVSGVPS